MATTPKPKKPGQAAEASTALYDVISPLEHDLVRFAIGDQVELTDAEAAPLLGHTVKPAEPNAA